MDNQPTTPAPNNAPQPPAPAPVTPQPPVAPPTPPVTSQPPVPTPTPPQPIDSKKKSHKGLIIGIICAVLVLIGGCAAAAIIIPKTQPSNMLASAINNLLTAKQVAIDGQVDIATDQLPGDNNIKINLNSLSSGSDYSTTATVQANLPALGIESPLTLELSDMMMSDGIIYFKVKGIQDILTDENISAVATTLGGAANSSATQYAQKIAALLEDQWISVSLKEIADEFPQLGIAQQLDQIECTTNIFKNISQYSNELTGNYINAPFLAMTPQGNSFYGLSLDTTQLANFTNSLPKTQLVKDLASCYNAEINPSTITQISSSDLEGFAKTFPSVSVKFDGFLDYYLSELKVSNSQDNDAISTTADLKFSYNTGSTVTAPTDTTSIVDIINMLMALSPVSPTVYNDCSSETDCITNIYDYETTFDSDTSLY